MSEKAILAGGCFWGMQDLIRRQPGVISTRVGYSGGDVPNATYRNHGTHAEAIEIVFDPEQTSYRNILEFFFQIHDPTTLNRQGNDVGTSYRSAIFYLDDEQRRIAEDTIADVEASGLWPGKVVTEVSRRGRSGKRSPSIRTTSSTIRTAIRAISRDPAGCCHGGRRRSDELIGPPVAQPALSGGGMTRVQRMTLVAAILGSSIAAIDGTIVNVALPAIQDDLGGGLQAQQWISNAYTLTLGSLILIGGSLGDIYGKRRVFAIGVGAFGVLSLVCAWRRRSRR